MNNGAEFDLIEVDSGARTDQLLRLANAEISVPASLHFTPLLCAALREYCVALLTIVSADNTGEHGTRTKSRHHIRKSTLKLPGNEGTTITSSYRHLVYSLELALQEAATNIVRHGYHQSGDPLQQRIRLCLSIKHVQDSGQIRQRALLIELFDNGQTFDTANADFHTPDPTELNESGYGLYLIHKLTDQLFYFHQNGQNCLQLLKYI